MLWVTLWQEQLLERPHECAAPKGSQSQAKGQKSTKYCICSAWMTPCIAFRYFAILL